MKIPARYEHFVFGVVQSGLTCAVAAAIATTPHALDLAFAGRWLNAWVSMLPVVVLAAPMIRRVVRRMTVG
ncbi:GNAT family acetyltransferase [Arthrobacter stackebrandtii]|nr:GNAT family acetyltransferase [Arthrobacter stackebrandtii]